MYDSFNPLNGIVTDFVVELLIDSKFSQVLEDMHFFHTVERTWQKPPAQQLCDNAIGPLEKTRFTKRGRSNRNQRKRRGKKTDATLFHHVPPFFCRPKKHIAPLGVGPTKHSFVFNQFPGPL